MNLATCTKNLFLLGLIVLGGVRLHAQQSKYVKSNELSHDYKTDFTKLIATGRAYTGYEFTFYYYPNNTDTQQVTCYVNGRTEWIKRFFTNGQLEQYEVRYHHGFRNDSICREWVRFSAGKGDTTDYGCDYIDRNGVKWSANRSYYPRKAPGEKLPLRTINTGRFFTKKETKNFTGKEFKDKENYDSLGYYRSGWGTGIETMYYDNGIIWQQGRNSTYDYALAHHGDRIPGPYGGKTGVWTYYDSKTGLRTGVNIFDESGYQLESQGYYPDGSMSSRVWYEILFSGLHLPSPGPVPLQPGDTCYRVEAQWYENGGLTSVKIQTRNHVEVEYAYYSNGHPIYFHARSDRYSYYPIGIFREWDEQGHPTRFMNYADTTNDTLCYIGKMGQITAVNLRNKPGTGSWKGSAFLSSEDDRQRDMKKHTDVYREYFLNGKMKREVHMKDGECSGSYSEWNDSGTILLKADYTNGRPDGEWMEWHANGQLKKYFHYRSGIRDSVCREYYANGNLKWENTYINGVPGSGKAYSENGTRLGATNYVEAFFPSECVDKEIIAVQPTAQHYFFLDSTSNKNTVVLKDSAFRNYTLKIIAMSSLLVPENDFCDGMPVDHNIDGFDIHHSRFAITASLYNDTGKAIITSFFGRNGISLDSAVLSAEPVFGEEAEFLVYYSSPYVLNKQLIADSLDWYVLYNANGTKPGYIIHLDNYIPEANIGPSRRFVYMQSDTGYSRVTIDAANHNRRGFQWGYYFARHYIIYDDMTCDLQYLETNEYYMMYWPM